eukprot:4305805-Pyramimonas_sp.AAC.1
MYDNLKESLARCADNPTQRPNTPSTCPEYHLAVNPQSGIVHRITAGYTVPTPCGWIIACGWKPSDLAAATMEHALPSSYKKMCCKCLPAERAWAKATAQ